MARIAYRNENSTYVVKVALLAVWVSGVQTMKVRFRRKVFEMRRQLLLCLDLDEQTEHSFCHVCKEGCTTFLLKGPMLHLLPPTPEVWLQKLYVRTLERSAAELHVVGHVSGGFLIELPSSVSEDHRSSLLDEIATKVAQYIQTR